MAVPETEAVVTCLLKVVNMHFVYPTSRAVIINGLGLVVSRMFWRWVMMQPSSTIKHR